MAISTSTLRPGLLVSLKTSIRGNVSYRTLELETDHLTEEGARRAKWETERTISDPEEHEAGIKVRSKIRGLIVACCAQSAFGLLCPENAAGDLDKAIADARELADTYNAKARLTRVAVFVIAGRIAPDDVEAVKAINSEIRDLLADMERGVRTLQVEVIREAANKARAIASMITPEAAARVQVAIDTARSAARTIVKAGEVAGLEIDAKALRAITEAKGAFLDLDEAQEVQVPTEQARAIDLAPADDFEPPKFLRASAPQMLFEL